MEITLKSTFDAQEVARIHAEIRQREGEVALLRQALKHYRNVCSHPKMKHYTDRSGVSCSYCDTCGYEQ